MKNATIDTVGFIKDTLDGEEIFRLENGTKYLPSLYIKNNPHFNKWMLFEAENSRNISNQTFATQKDCIEYIANYDENSDKTLLTLVEELKTSDSYDLVKQIDFLNPKQITPITSDNGLDLIIHAQKSEIATHYETNIKKIKLILSVFDGLLSLYVNESDNHQNKLIYYVFNNGAVSSYTAWKTVSVAMAIHKNILAYEKERNHYQSLKKISGKALVDSEGNGFLFDKYIEGTNFVYAQKVRVIERNGEKFTDTKAPLTPLFLAQLTVAQNQITLHVKNHYRNINDKGERYIIKM